MGKISRKEGKIGGIYIIVVVSIIRSCRRRGKKIAFTCLTERMMVILQYYNIIRERPAAAVYLSLPGWEARPSRGDG